MEVDMTAKKIITFGERFDKLVFISDSEGKSNKRYVFCRCDCGTTRNFRWINIQSKKIRSCGCSVNNIPQKAQVKHGKSNTITYGIYNGMLQRCLNYKNNHFKDYGGRGITVCERWLAGFEFFLADMGECPLKHTIERSDVNNGYSPENCIWAMNDVQQNNKRTSRFIEFNGERKTIAQWASELGMTRHALRGRIDLGWSIEMAFNTPIDKKQIGHNIMIEHNGRSMTMRQWSEDTGIGYDSLKQRRSLGWSVEKMLTTPKGRRYG
jgi:hypothetical protein